MAQDQTRRNFLRTAPLAAAVSLPLAEQFLFASHRRGGRPRPGAFQPFTSGKLAEQRGRRRRFGNEIIRGEGPAYDQLTVEEKKSGKEFEYHEP
jgi:hypothetical protein